MDSIKWTETEKNLIRSFIWESQARMKYDYFSEEAKREWYEQISEIFTETAQNEKEHARIFFNFLEGNYVEIPIISDAWNIWTTMQNLEISAKWENEEWEILYPKFTKIAEKEWLKEVAFAFEMISRVEKAHEERFRKLRDKKGWNLPPDIRKQVIKLIGKFYYLN